MSSNTPASNNSPYLGARWLRAALQVNPYEYKGASSPSLRYSDEAAYNTALLDACEAEGVELIAVTDHWAVNTAAGLILAAASRPITVLPGFEANTSEGIHVLVIFEEGTELTEVNAAIGACGVSPGCENGTTGLSFAETVTAMIKRQALVIPAHANANRGMLKVLGGRPLETMVKNPGIHAIGISPGVEDARDQSDVIANKKPYERDHALAAIHADDVCDPSVLSKVGTTTWFKGSSPSLTAIRHAIRIPRTRVSTSRPGQETRVLFRRLSWIGGFLDTVSIDLAEDLTAFIGGRGTGKSSAIESIRYVLDIEPIGESAKADHRALVRNVLQAGTVIRLEVEAVSPRRDSFVIQRTLHDPPVVIDSAGRRTQLKPVDVVGRIEIFGQHELAEVAQQKTSVAQMIQAFTGTAEGDDGRPKLMQQLQDNREKLARQEKERGNLEEELADIPRLEAAVEQFTASDLPGKLEEQKRFGQDSATFTEARERIASANVALSQLTASNVANELIQEFEAVEGSPNEAILRKVAAATKTLSDEVAAAQASLVRAIKTAEDAVSNAHSEWEQATEAQRQKHAEVIRELKANGHEPERYLTTIGNLDQLKAKSPRLASMDRQIQALKDDRVVLLGQLEAIEVNQRATLAGAVRAANAATGGAVLVRPVPSPDRGAIVKAINDSVSKSRNALLEVAKAEDFSPRSFVEAAREGSPALAERYGLRGAQLDAIEAAGESFLREFEELSVGYAVDVSLDIGPAGQRNYRLLDELSKGQRATALLLLLLGASQSPLIIDQPEDDLDNRFVYDHVVERLRELKGARQVIVSTHNANVPVLGDAELIVTLDGDGKNGWCMEGCTGSLDAPQVREIAEHILEGGRTAFDERRHLYGF